MATPPAQHVAATLSDDIDHGRQTTGTDILPFIARGPSGTAIKLKPAIKLKTMKLKLYVDRAHKKAFFAEVGKDAVDLLFSILALPLGSLIRLFGKQSPVGCLDKLYHSLESLDPSYIQPNQRTMDLLSPKVASLATFGNAAPLIWKVEDFIHPPIIYYCLSCWRDKYPGYYSHDLGVTCPGCFNKIEEKMVYGPPLAGGEEGTSASGTGSGAEKVGGFVKGLVRYIVTDDLEVSSESYMSACTLLEKFDTDSLEVMMVDLNMTKAREMLKVSWHSTTVLTDVFLPKKLKRGRVSP